MKMDSHFPSPFSFRNNSNYLAFNLKSNWFNKGQFTVTDSLFILQNDIIIHLSIQTSFHNMKYDSKTEKLYYKNLVLDADNKNISQPDLVILWNARPNNDSQRWILETRKLPFQSAKSELVDVYSGHKEINKYLHINLLDNFLDNFQTSVKVYYSKKYINTPTQAFLLLNCIPVISINGDEYLKLPNGNELSKMDQSIVNRYNLLNYEERKTARHIVVISKDLIIASGGYNNPITFKTKPRNYWNISLPGPQFELPYLEASDLIITHLSKNYQEVKINPKKYGAIKIVDSFLLAEKYKQIIKEDLLLVTHAWSKSLGSKLGCLRLVAVGMGFFANLWTGEGNISNLLIPLFMEVLMEIIHFIPNNITDLELLDFTGSFRPPQLKIGTSQRFGFITIHHRHNLDVYAEPIILNREIGVINPSDAFSWKGNEYDYQSVEAMMGNNSTLRITQVLARNKHLYELDRYIGIS